MHQIAEHYAKPLHGELGGSFARVNDFNHKFFLRWGKIDFEMFHGDQMNLKVVLKVYRQHNICETYIVDTDAYDIKWNHHRRRTRDFYIHPFSNSFGVINCVKFSFLIHQGEHSIASEKEYIFMDWGQLHGDSDTPQYRNIDSLHSTQNHYRTYELQAHELQSDVDWMNHHFESLHLVPKFTKGQLNHPFHPKSYIVESLLLRLARAIPRAECAKLEKPSDLSNSYS